MGKVLRYVLSSAGTGFDPAQVSDLYSRDVHGEYFRCALASCVADRGPEPYAIASLRRSKGTARTGASKKNCNKRLQ